jgi:hypothetical protein
VTNIEIIAHDYVRSDVIEDIFIQNLDVGSHKIVFNQPFGDIVIDAPAYTEAALGTEGGDYLATESGDYLEIGAGSAFNFNALYLNLTMAGLVTITGYPYIDTTTIHAFTEAGASEIKNKADVSIDVTMVNSNNAETVLNTVRDYYRERYAQNMTVLPTTEKPGDIVLTGSLYDNMIVGQVQKMDIDLVGGFLITADILGSKFEFVQPLDNPVRRPRTNVAICGSELTRQNMFREYA